MAFKAFFQPAKRSTVVLTNGTTGGREGVYNCLQRFSTRSTRGIRIENRLSQSTLSSSTSTINKRAFHTSIPVLNGSNKINSESKEPERNPIQQYDHYVETGRIQNDSYQRKVLKNLEFLYNELLSYTPPDIQSQPASSSSSSFSSVGKMFGKLFGSGSKSSQGSSTRLNIPIGTQPNGIYLYGDVGCGKSMLMDMFYTTIPSHLTKKRIHFHAFMQDVHKRSYALHEVHGIDFDTAPTIARDIAKGANVLCFDEFQVTDVADAMILRRLIEAFMSPELGVVLFMTSNRAPDDLYANGIQRDSFIPTIELIKTKCEVMYLKSPTDYRKIDRPSDGTYFFPPTGKSLQDVSKEADEHVEKWFKYFSNNKTPESNVQLHIWGRPVNIPKSVDGAVAQFPFSELFNKFLSAADYLEITRAYPAIIVTDIPYLSVNQRDVTRRFITFLDAAYESHTKLAVTAVRPFEQIFTDEIPKYGKQSAHVLEIEKKLKQEEEADESKKKNKETNLSEESSTKKEAGNSLKDNKAIAGDDERFAFSRALSRLKQMGSKDWNEYVRPE